MSDSEFSLILYSTSGCHLCEFAQQVLLNCQQHFQLIGQKVTIKEVDIADDERLVERYGVFIPVIRLERNGQELKWPFDERAVIGFLGNAS